MTEEAERSLTEAQKKLARKDLELQSQDDRIQRLQEKITQVERLSSLSKEEMSQLRSTVNAVDREKDSLQVAVDEKTERLACVTDDLIEKVGTDRVITCCGWLVCLFSFRLCRRGEFWCSLCSEEL